MQPQDYVKGGGINRDRDRLNAVLFLVEIAERRGFLNGVENYATPSLVQSLNSPFFPPHIGAEPRRAKEESRITCMRMLRTPPFFPPNRGKNHIWKYFVDLLVAQFSE